MAHPICVMNNPFARAFSRIAIALAAATAFATVARPAAAQSAAPGDPARTAPAARLSDEPEIDAGFRLLYELKFAEARETFAKWQAQHADDALGPAAAAASNLFQEFDRQGVLTSEFFLDDDKLLGGVKSAPDPGLRDAFHAAIGKAQQLARARLASNPHDADALFALTIATGMLADYTSLIERRQLDSLKLIRQADRDAHDLLAVAPGAADAYVALGAANYVIGCLPGYKRFVIWFGGFHGDRALGMQQLETASRGGHYLRPYAKLMLALAALREKKRDLAKTEFEQLAAEFPSNPRFAGELAKLNGTVGPAKHSP